MKSPLVSIIIVNWNGRNYLDKCLKSLQKVEYNPLEIIVVDQNSSDGSQKLVNKKYKKIILIENKDNTGYVGGNNLGVSKAKGKYILILNNDIEVDRKFLKPLVEAFENNPKLGVAQPKAINLRHKGKIDGAGSFMTGTGFLYHKGYLDSAKKAEYGKKYYVYSVKGAYMMTRRDLWNKLGGLDKDFFIYFEESDYCGRVWLSGHTVEYIPDGVVYHWGAGDTAGDWKKKFATVQYRSIKNRICSYIKNLSPKNLLQIMFVHIILVEGYSFYSLIKGDLTLFISIQKAIFWNVSNLQKTLIKRKSIQNNVRKVSDFEIFQKSYKSTGIGYYIKLLGALSIK